MERLKILLFINLMCISVTQAHGEEKDCKDLTVVECVQQISRIANNLDTKLKSVINQISRTEVPVGTVITSTLPPEQFLVDTNPQYDANKWTIADGRSIPPDSLYAILSHGTKAPDLTHLQQQLIVLDVISGAAMGGQTIRQLYTPKYANENWVTHFGIRDVEGNRFNDDYEQDADQFQLIPDSGTLKVQGRTYNFKHKKYGDWKNGSSNFIAIATKANGLFYYVKIN